MRYSQEDDTLYIDVAEFVGLARRGVSESIPIDEQEPDLTPDDRYTRRRYLGTDAPSIPLMLPTTLDSHSLCVRAYADTIEGDVLHYLCITDRLPDHPPRQWREQIRGVAYVGAYAYALATGAELVSIIFHIVNPSTDATVEFDEHVSVQKLNSFFKKCKQLLSKYADPAIHRATVRLPSMANAKFPYGQMRAGQDELVQTVFRTVTDGGSLIAEAPTGIGKTVSVLYPAIRAMGKGACEKIFYLTPKTTTATAALSCLDELFRCGVDLRAVSLTAKEKICPLRMICREGKGKCPLLNENKLTEGALKLFSLGTATVDADVIRRVATELSVCPYELSLTYSELCDVVISDFNYLYDRRVYLRRFFDTPGDYTFLIDEAHNLPDRAREMYSAELTARDLPFEDYPLSEHSPLAAAIAGARTAWRELLFPLVKAELRRDEHGQPVGAAHGTRLPEGLSQMFSALTSAADEEIKNAFADKTEERELRLSALRSYYYRIKSFAELLDRFDEHYEYFVFYEEDVLRLKLFCIDPSAVIRERTELGKSAVFFSATLTPISFYRYQLGYARDASTLSVPSPFDPSQLSVSIMDKISTRSSERERTLPEVLRVVAATVSARRGHYIVFTPSFEYTERIAAAFSAKYPKIRTMVQGRQMSKKEKEDFMAAFSRDESTYLVAFCVTGGIFSEGIDLWGNRLIGTVVVGVTLPSLSFERESMAQYYEQKYEMGKQFAYVYPGLGKVLQAAGRVIRREDDYGVIVLIDDRFADPLYRKSIPTLWHGLKFVGEAKGLRMLLDRFWSEADAIRERNANEQQATPSNAGSSS